jgi:tetratricopeptide (TPR) repeat protein
MKREWIIALCLIAITLAVFIQVRNFDFVRYDDDKYVLQNHPIQSGPVLEKLHFAFTSFHASNWHPLTWLSHMADYALYGLNPRGHHLTNVMLHILSTLLLFAVFRQMTGALWPSAFAAALFAVHPLHVESVAWVAERKDCLSAFFFMLTLGAYFRYVKEPGFSRYVLIVIFFALGLMSKPMLVTLPFVLLLLDVWPLRRFRLGPTAKSDRDREAVRTEMAAEPLTSFPRLFREKIPLFALSAVSIVVTVLAQRQEIAPFAKLPLLTRLANALVAYVTYAGKMIWPQNLAVLYPYPDTVPLWQTAGAGIILIIVTGLVMKYLRRAPYLAVGWLWYLGTLVPVIGIVQVGVQSHADRYTYLPLIGLFAMIAWGIPDLMKKWRLPTMALAAPAVIVIAVFAALSWLQLAHWQNSITLFDRTLKVTKNNYVIHSNMGAALAEQGKIVEAVAHYEEALRIKPDDVDSRYNLANALARQGKMPEAMVQYMAVLRMEPRKAAAHNNLAIALAANGQVDKARDHWREALKLRPDYEEARVNLKNSLERQKKLEDASLKDGAPPAMDARSADGRMRLGMAALQTGNPDGAVAHFEEALKINPRFIEAHLSLGLIMAKKQNLDRAIHHFQEALKIKPDMAEAHNSLGVALAYKNRVDQAMGHFQEALKINPRFAKAHNSLAVILAQKGRTEEAIAHLKEALKINPDYEDAKRNLKIIGEGR